MFTFWQLLFLKSQFRNVLANGFKSAVSKVLGFSSVGFYSKPKNNRKIKISVAGIKLIPQVPCD